MVARSKLKQGVLASYFRRRERIFLAKMGSVVRIILGCGDNDIELDVFDRGQER